MTKFEDVRSYYLSQWGDPSREAEFKKGDINIGVLKWSRRRSTGDVNLYATLGVSTFPCPGVEASHRQEFFLGLLPEADDLASPLAMLGAHSRLAGEQIGSGHVYRSRQDRFGDTGLAGFIVIEPLDGMPAPISLDDGSHVEFLMVIPVFLDEVEFAVVNGVDALLEMMETRHVPFWNPRRKSTF